MRSDSLISEATSIGASSSQEIASASAASQASALSFPATCFAGDAPYAHCHRRERCHRREDYDSAPPCHLTPSCHCPPLETSTRETCSVSASAEQSRHLCVATCHRSCELRRIPHRCPPSQKPGRNTSNGLDQKRLEVCEEIPAPVMILDDYAYLIMLLLMVLVNSYALAIVSQKAPILSKPVL